MKKLNRYILIGITSLIFIGSFLIPKTNAQPWPYDGANTERIPEFSVYPSEWYVLETSYLGMPQNHSIIEIGGAIINDTFNGMTSWLPYYGTFTNGTVISFNVATWNMTDDDPFWDPGVPDDAIYWNGTAYLAIGAMLVPINESTGTVTEDILDSFVYYMDATFTEMTGSPFEHKAVYPNIYSIALWNTSNNAQIYMNFTADGILQKQESYNTMYAGNMTLYSRPAQLAPVFSFTTDTGELELDTTDLTLNMTITDADNNNDQETDTDYLYRIHNGTGWTDWAAPTSQIDCEIAATTAGDYDILIEVKNMYGTTQEQITITYTPPGDGEDIIPSYPIAIISLVAIFSVSLIILKQSKKLRL